MRPVKVGTNVEGALNTLPKWQQLSGHDYFTFPRDLYLMTGTFCVLYVL